VLTGNTIFAAQSAAKGCWYNVLVYVLVIISYVAGMVVFRLVDFLMRKYVPGCKLGPVTVMGTFVLWPMFIMADVTYYYWDHDFPDGLFGCGKDPDNGVWGILLIACPMGAINGVSMKIDSCTTNAVTGHFLSLSSALFDICVEGRHGMKTQAKHKMVVSAGVILMLVSGITMGQAIASHSDFDNYQSFNPTFTILGLFYAAALAAHGIFHLEDWHPEPHNLGAEFNAADKTEAELTLTISNEMDAELSDTEPNRITTV